MTINYGLLTTGYKLPAFLKDCHFFTFLSPGTMIDKHKRTCLPTGGNKTKNHGKDHRNRLRNHQ